MTTLRAVSLALGLIVGIVLGARWPESIWQPGLPWASAAGACLSALLYVRQRTWQPAPGWVVVLAAFLFTAPLGCWRAVQAVDPSRADRLRYVLANLPDGASLGLRGSVSAEPERRTLRDGDLQVRVDSVRTGAQGAWRRVDPEKVLVRVFLSRESGSAETNALERLMDPRCYGYRVEVGTVHHPVRRARNPGEFDMVSFLLQNGLVAQLRAPIDRISILDMSRGNPLMELALATKRNFLETYRLTIRDPASRLVAGVTLGSRRAVEKVDFQGLDITRAFRMAGVGHVLAVSGLHVSIVSLLLYAMFTLMRFRQRVFAVPLILFLFLFALLTGARPSSLRAVIMNAVILIAFVYFRCSVRRATMTGLAISALVILTGSPIVLFSAGFLLSYGAVLSLILVTPPVARWLFRLRGWSLILALLWLAGVYALSAKAFGWLLSPYNWLALAGLLWLLMIVGGRLNERFPRFWRIGLGKAGKGLSLFVCAQVAIQLGMMIPLSAWFFGQFPVAGMIVNLIAIPAVGVLVQLGMLTGLMGMIPVIGPYLAVPFGAASTVVGIFFLWLAYLGAVLFPYPSVPKPSLFWMAAYYAVLGLVISCGGWGTRLQRGFQRLVPALEHRSAVVRWAWLVPLAMMALPLFDMAGPAPRCARVTCLAAGPYPVLSLVSDRHAAITINAGDANTATRLLFPALRAQGVTAIRTAILCGPQPQAGNEGLAALTAMMRIGECYAPVVAEKQEDYLDAIGDRYLAHQAADGQTWAVAYDKAYASLRQELGRRGVPLRQIKPGVLGGWSNADWRALPGPRELPRRFVASARTTILRLNVSGFRWGVVTESLPEIVEHSFSGEPPLDILVLPDLSSRAAYRELVDAAIAAARPGMVIVTAGSRKKGFDPRSCGLEDRPFILLRTDADGAVFATPQPDGTLLVRTFASGKRFTLQPAREP